jgi:hypothetical protein
MNALLNLHVTAHVSPLIGSSAVLINSDAALLRLLLAVTTWTWILSLYDLKYEGAETGM